MSPYALQRARETDLTRDDYDEACRLSAESRQEVRAALQTNATKLGDALIDWLCEDELRRYARLAEAIHAALRGDLSELQRLMDAASVQYVKDNATTYDADDIADQRMRELEDSYEEIDS